MRHASVLSAALLAAALAACDSSTDPDTPLSLTTNPAVVNCRVGESVQLLTSLTGASGTPTVAATAQGTAATVTTSGTTVNVACASAGATTLTVTATVGGRSATSTIPVVVAPAPALTVVATPTTVTCFTGAVVPLGVTVTGAQGTTAPTLSFASSGPAATVSPAAGGATISCASPGTTNVTVTATSGAQTGTAVVTVGVSTPTPIVIATSPTAVACTAGDIVPLSVSITGSQSGGATLAFSSSSSAVASVIGNGSLVTVRCGSPGTATLTINATDNQQTGTLTVPVTVTAARLAVSLSSTLLTCVSGETRTLTASITGAVTETPSYVFATTSPSIGLTWTGNRATITCSSPGTATVTATATTPTGSGSATATVTVASPIAGLTLTPATAAATPGSTLILTPTVAVRPGAPAGTVANVRYVTSNAGIATVAPNADGSATVSIVQNSANINLQVAITAISLADPSIQATSTIVIVDPAALIQSVTLTNTTLALNTGDTTRLLPSVILASTAPANTSRAVTYRSSNTAVATVDAEGLITGRGAGTATITVASVVAPSVNTTASVTVAGTGTNPGGAIVVQPTAYYTFNQFGQAVPANFSAISGNLRVDYTVDPGSRLVDAVNLELGGSPVIRQCQGAIPGVTGASCTLATAATDPGTGARIYPNGSYPLNIVVVFRESTTSVQQRLVTTVGTITINNP